MLGLSVARLSRVEREQPPEPDASGRDHATRGTLEDIARPANASAVLLRGGGWWHRSSDGLRVILKAPETPCYYRAARDLPDHWNRVAGTGMPRLLLETKGAVKARTGNGESAPQNLSAEP